MGSNVIIVFGTLTDCNLIDNTFVNGCVKLTIKLTELFNLDGLLINGI